MRGQWKPHSSDDSFVPPAPSLVGHVTGLLLTDIEMKSQLDSEVMDVPGDAGQLNFPHSEHEGRNNSTT